MNNSMLSLAERMLIESGLAPRQKQTKSEVTKDATDTKMGVGVLVIKDGKILCGTRTDTGEICGPGGHIEAGESPEDAAVREAQEEFNITPLTLIPLGHYKGSSGLYCPSTLYFTADFTGTPKADNDEMNEQRWLSLQELENEKLFPPFEESIKTLLKVIGSEHIDGGPGSGNFGHKGVPGKVGGSAKGTGNLSALDFKKGNGDFEVTGDVADMYLTESTKSRVLTTTQKVHTAHDLKNYLSDHGIDMVVDYKPLQDNMDREISSVKQQADYIISAVEQYEELGGLNALKAVHIYNPDLEAQAQYSYRATGEGKVDDEGHLYISDRANGFQIMHEFAHAYADSTKPEGMDVVEWSAKLNKEAGLSDSQGAYFGAESSAMEAERFADAVGSALCYGQGSADRLTFLSKVASIVNNGADGEDNSNTHSDNKSRTNILTGGDTTATMNVRLDGSTLRQDEDQWVTIKGTHVLIGENGEVKGGPDNLKGMSFSKAKSVSNRGGGSRSSNTKKTSIESKDLKSMERMNNVPPEDVYYEAELRQKGIVKYSKEYNAAIRKFQSKKWQKENGSNEEWAEKNFDKYVDHEKQVLERKMAFFQDGDASVEYETKIIKPMERSYKKSIALYSDYENDIKPREFYELQKKSMEGMTTEDFAVLDKSYYHGSKAYESSYKDYSNVTINGGELNWAQQKLEQIVTDHSVEIPEGKTFFRKTGEDEFIALTGKSLAEFDNNAPASERTATISKCTSFGSAVQYDVFSLSNVLIEYKTKSGAKAFFSTNTDEAEGILPPGTKISNITVKGYSEKKVPTIFRAKSGDTDKTIGMSKARYTDDGTKVTDESYYDFSYNGKGSLNDYRKSMAQLRQSQSYNPNLNKLVRVEVEVE